MLVFMLHRCLVTQRRVKIATVVVLDPNNQFVNELDGAFPLMQPDEFLFEGTHEPLGIGVAFGVVVTGEGLADAEALAGCMKAIELG